MRYSALLISAVALGSLPMSAQPQSDPPAVISLPGTSRPGSGAESSARTAVALQRPAPRFMVGGKEMVLPGPSNDFEEVGDRLRTTFFEMLTHPSDRLVAAYITSQTLADLTAGKATNGLGVSGMVETPRSQEYADCTPESFREVAAGIKQSLGETDSDRLAGQIQGAMGDRLNSVGLKSVELAGFKLVGTAFQKRDASGYLVQEVVQQGNRKILMIGGISALRVKERLILVCLFRKNESPDTVSSVRTDLENWADRLLAENQ